MADTSDIKNGLCIELNNDLFQVIEFQHKKPGKGSAFVRTKLKSLTSGKVIQETFPSGHKIKTARIERRPHQYLYNDETGYHFMNNETFEQVNVPKNLINAPDLMKEGQGVDILFHADTETPLTCELPPFVDMEITYTEPGVKGDTATNTMKEATVETGATIRVPLFINNGEKIKVDTRNHQYAERIKS